MPIYPHLRFQAHPMWARIAAQVRYTLEMNASIQPLQDGRPISTHHVQRDLVDQLNSGVMPMDTLVVDSPFLDSNYSGHRGRDFAFDLALMTGMCNISLSDHNQILGIRNIPPIKRVSIWQHRTERAKICMLPRTDYRHLFQYRIEIRW
jgi:hypothetical protein